MDVEPTKSGVELPGMVQPSGCDNEVNAMSSWDNEVRRKTYNFFRYGVTDEC